MWYHWLWKHWLFETTVTWLFQWSIKVSVDHSTLTILQPQPTIQVRVKHCTLALRSALHSPTPTFWNAGIFWNHSRPSLQSQSPLQACRLSLNAPGCPAISREDPTLQEKPMHVQFRRLQVDDSRLRKKDADTKLQASFTKVNSRTGVRFATSFSTANFAGNDSLRSRSRTAHNRFLQPLRFSFLCERPQSPDRSKNAFSSANLYHIEYFTYLTTVSSSDVSTFVAFLT